MSVLHHCDNPPCCRPSHLFLGTPADNMADMDRKGRRRTGNCAGEANGRAKLTEAQVQAIRAEYAAAPRKVRIRRGSLSDIAARYGVTTTMIGYVVKRKFWRNC